MNLGQLRATALFSRIRQRWYWIIAIVVVSAASPARARAQTIGQYAAWDALMVSPVGAFVATGSGVTAGSPTNSLALRVGQWRYNADDAAHGIYGLTFSRGVGSRSRASVTGGYVHVACGDCVGWAIWGVDLETRMLQAGRGERLWQPGTTLGVRLSAGGGGLRGRPHSIARTAALQMPVDVRVRYHTNHYVWASLNPGVGYGNVWGPSGSDGGVLPMLGATMGLGLTSSLGIELGAHRVYIAGGPLDVGASFAWAFR